MGFKEWLILTENAHRTGTKVCNYPPAYDTHPYDYMGVPIFHTGTSADYITWLTLKVKPFTWTNYESMAASDGEKIVDTWKRINLSAPQNYGTGEDAVKSKVIDRIKNI